MPVPHTPPPIADEVTLARYPFLPQASEWIRGMALRHSINLDELLDGSWMDKARQRARLRLIDTVQSKEGVQVSGGDIHTEEGRIVEAFSFYYARLVVCASEDERLVARWAQAEAARAEQLLMLDAVNLPLVANTYVTELRVKVRRTCGKSGCRILLKSVRKSPGSAGGCQMQMSKAVGSRCTTNANTRLRPSLQGCCENESKPRLKRTPLKKWLKSTPIWPFVWLSRWAWFET